MGGIYYKGCNLLQKFDRHLRIQLDLIYSIQFKKFKIIPPITIFGARKWIRTTDLLITNQLLCQLSYAGLQCNILLSLQGKIAIRKPKKLFCRLSDLNIWTVIGRLFFLREIRGCNTRSLFFFFKPSEAPIIATRTRPNFHDKPPIAKAEIFSSSPHARSVTLAYPERIHASSARRFD